MNELIKRRALERLLTSFLEIVAWLGIAMCAQQLNALLVAAGMASYLSGRAIATTRWYTKRFGDKWPKARRHLVPFLF